MNPKLKQMIEQLITPEVQDEMHELVQRAHERMADGHGSIVFFSPVRELTPEEQEYIDAHERLHQNFQLLITPSPSSMVH